MSVHEAVDASSYLLAPADSGAQFMQSLRWEAGFLLGGIDWLAEQLTGMSVLGELVFKPLAGDWSALERGVSAWGHAGTAASYVGSNFEALVAQTEASWDGETARAFRARMVSLADGYRRYGDGCTAMASVTDALVDLTKSACSVLATILSLVSDLLTRLAIEAAVPVLGWAAGVVDAALHAKPVIDLITRGYQVIQKIIEALEMLARIARIVQDLAQAVKLVADTVAAGARVATVSRAGAATSSAFGTA